jgi:hypothetical protein
LLKRTVLPLVNDFSGGQCSRTAENFRRIMRCALQFFSLL